MFDWDDKHCLKFSYTLRPSMEADGCYVTESTSMTTTTVKFGPMRADQMYPFIEERKRYWAMMAEKAKQRIAH